MRRILQPHDDARRINVVNLGILVCLIAITASLAVHASRIEWFKPAAGDDILQVRISELESQILEIQTRELQGAVSARVRVTCYQSEERQTDSTPWTTAINTKCRPGIVAVSRDLLEAGWSFGRQVWIEGYGVYTIEDVMNARLVRSIDIWVPIDARPFAQDNVLAVLVER